MLTRPGVRVGERIQQAGRRRDRVDHPKRRRVRRDRPEQRVLLTHRPEIGEAVAAISEHHRQIAHHAAGIMPGAALLEIGQANRQRLREPALVSDLRQQRAARMRHEPFSVRRDFYRDVAAISLHLQGDPPELGPGPSTSRIVPAQPDVSAPRPRSGRSPCCTIRAKRQQFAAAASATRWAVPDGASWAIRCCQGRLKTDPLAPVENWVSCHGCG